MSVYAFALFFNAALSFGTFSLLTHYLDEVDYGIINLYTSFTMFIVPFVSIGVPFTLSVDYFKMDATAYRSHFTNAIMIPVIMSAVMIVVFLILFQPLQSFLKTNLFFLLTLPVNCLIIVFNDIALNTARNKGKHFLYAGLSTFRYVIETAATLLLVIGLSMNWTGRLGGALIALVATGIIIFSLLIRWNLYTGTFKKKDIKKTFYQGLPFIPERLAIFFMAYSDRFFIDHFAGTGDVGYYGAGAQVALIVNLTILTLISTFQPYLFKGLAASDWKSVRKGTVAFIGISLAVTLVVIAIIPLLFGYFIGSNFQQGQIYARYLTIGFFFWSVYMAFVSYLLYIKLNRMIMAISIAGILVSVSLNLITVRYFGAIGATYTSMTVYFFMAAACIYTVHKKFNLKKILFPA